MSNTPELLCIKQDLYELSCMYMRGVDRLDRPLLRSVFHDDAKCNYGFLVGTADEFVDYAINALTSHKSNHHFIGNSLYDISGDEAFGEVYFQAYHLINRDGQDMDMFISGRYLDRYTKRNNEWKISYRSEANDWSRTGPSADEYRLRRVTALRGGRLDDPVYRRDLMR